MIDIGPSTDVFNSKDPLELTDGGGGGNLGNCELDDAWLLETERILKLFKHFIKSADVSVPK